MVVMSRVTQGTGDQYREHRAQTLAATLDNVFRNLTDQGHLGVQLLPDNPIHGRHILFYQLVNAFKTHETPAFSLNPRWGMLGIGGDNCQ
jgi:hypothetical protein